MSYSEERTPIENLILVDVSACVLKFEQMIRAQTAFSSRGRRSFSDGAGTVPGDVLEELKKLNGDIVVLLRGLLSCNGNANLAEDVRRSLQLLINRISKEGFSRGGYFSPESARCDLNLGCLLRLLSALSTSDFIAESLKEPVRQYLDRLNIDALKQAEFVVYYNKYTEHYTSQRLSTPDTELDFGGGEAAADDMRAASDIHVAVDVRAGAVAAAGRSDASPSPAVTPRALSLGMSGDDGDTSGSDDGESRHSGRPLLDAHETARVPPPGAGVGLARRSSASSGGGLGGSHGASSGVVGPGVASRSVQLPSGASRPLYTPRQLSDILCLAYLIMESHSSARLDQELKGKANQWHALFAGGVTAELLAVRNRAAVIYAASFLESKDRRYLDYFYRITGNHALAKEKINILKYWATPDAVYVMNRAWQFFGYIPYLEQQMRLEESEASREAFQLVSKAAYSKTLGLLFAQLLASLFLEKSSMFNQNIINVMLDVPLLLLMMRNQQLDNLVLTLRDQGLVDQLLVDQTRAAFFARHPELQGALPDSHCLSDAAAMTLSHAVEALIHGSAVSPGLSEEEVKERLKNWARQLGAKVPEGDLASNYEQQRKAIFTLLLSKMTPADIIAYSSSMVHDNELDTGVVLISPEEKRKEPYIELAKKARCAVWTYRLAVVAILAGLSFYALIRNRNTHTVGPIYYPMCSGNLVTGVCDLASGMCTAIINISNEYLEKGVGFGVGTEVSANPHFMFKNVDTTQWEIVEFNLLRALKDLPDRVALTLKGGGVDSAFLTVQPDLTEAMAALNFIPSVDCSESFPIPCAPSLAMSSHTVVAMLMGIVEASIAPENRVIGLLLLMAAVGSGLLVVKGMRSAFAFMWGGEERGEEAGRDLEGGV